MTSQTHLNCLRPAFSEISASLVEKAVFAMMLPMSGAMLGAIAILYKSGKSKR